MPQCETIDNSKRRLFGICQKTPSKPSFEPRSHARPPYAVDESLFTRLCDGCGQCLSVCPSQIIELKEGVAALDISYTSCDLCGKCQAACPTLALSGQTLSTGVVAKVSNSCENLYGYCSSCADSCQYDALEWREDAKPLISTDKCNGCGQCAQGCYTSMISFQLKC